MARIEVSGTFVFDEGTAEFTFADKTIEFHRISTTDELRGCLVLIAQTGAQRSVESILRGPCDTQSGDSPPVKERTSLAQAQFGIQEAIRAHERSFREHLANTEQQLKEAQEGHAAATTVAAG